MFVGILVLFVGDRVGGIARRSRCSKGLCCLLWFVELRKKIIMSHIEVLVPTLEHKLSLTLAKTQFWVS